MEPTLVTALAAAVGSLVGAGASIATTWIAQRTQTIREYSEWKLCQRESLYGEFITEASRLIVDALIHSLERPETLVTLYGILGRIRLLSGEEVLGEAEDCCRRIVELYSRPNMTPTQLLAEFEANKLDLLETLSAVCRKELLQISSTT
jgi:hypothetical protein